MKVVQIQELRDALRQWKVFLSSRPAQSPAHLERESVASEQHGLTWGCFLPPPCLSPPPAPQEKFTKTVIESVKQQMPTLNSRSI